MLKSLLLALGAATVCVASPARMFNRPASRQFGTVATVDCSNREAVEFVSKTHANFRCVYPDVNTRSGFSDGGNTQLFQSPSFPQGLQSASQIKVDDSACPPGQMYVPSVDTCLDAPKPLKTAPLESDSLIIEEAPLEIKAFSSSIQTAKDCTANQVFNSELSLCFDVKPNKNKRRPPPSFNLVKENSRPLEIQAFSSSQTASDCRPGEIYLSEIGSCVNLKNNNGPLQVANLIRSPDVFQKTNSFLDCGAGQVFVSELGICQYANPPKHQRPIVSDSLVKDTAPAIAVIDKIHCPPGEILVPELHICQPYNSPRVKPAPPASSSLIKEPEKLEIISFSKSMTKADCKPGEFFLSELSICV